jgi:1-acyl-sn-glycerol-3-phosphate acyltransferase
MQNIVIDKPYHFVPPVQGLFWHRIFMLFLNRYLRKEQGLRAVECLHLDRLQTSLAAGHGVMLAPNHCRPSDPMVLMQVGQQLGRQLNIMASWHLFMQSRFQAWALPRVGVFSVYREGLDREALKCAMQILAGAQRPLVIFPEGLISRSNDRLNNLMEGVALMARGAAKQRAAAQPPGRVVVHPVALRYFFEGDLEATLAPVIEEIEQRLTWQPQRQLALTERIVKIGDMLLALKEAEYLGAPQPGSFGERLQRLIDALLAPLEKEWLKGRRAETTVERVKLLRSAILPDMVAGELPEAERTRRWRQLADVYLAQQLHNYPPNYFAPAPTPERLLETVERYEEDLTDNVRVHAPVRAVVSIGTAIEVSATREKSADGDPLMLEIRRQLETMLEELKAHRRSA